MAFEAALALEDECRRFYAAYGDRQYPKTSGSTHTDSEMVYNDGDNNVAVDIESEKAGSGAPVPDEALWHLAVYHARPDVNVICGCALPGVMAASQRDAAITPLLDVFAQLIGPSARVAKADAIVKALKGRNAVKPISPLECRLMRFIYLNKYSKIKR